MRAENPFHEDLFKQLRDLFPTAAVPRRLPAIPRRQLERGDDAFEQRRVSALPALRILNQAVPVLMRWRGTRSALSGLRLRDDEGFRPLTPDGRKLFSMACGRGEFAGAANASLVEIMAATVAAACVEVQVQPKLRTAVRLLEHPNLGVFKTGEGVSVGRYMYGLGMVGSRIMTTLVMQAFNFTPGSPTRSIEVARRSEPLVLLGAAMAAQAGNSLFGITSGSPGVLSERGFLDEENMELLDWPALGEIIRPKRDVLKAVLSGLRRKFQGPVPMSKPLGRFGCLALRVRVGELNLVQFVYRWLLDALLEAKTY